MTYPSTESSPRRVERKLCCTCKKNRALENFTKDKRHPDGLSLMCRDCKSKAKEKYHAKKRACGGCQTPSKSDFDYDDDKYCISCTPLMFQEKGVDFNEDPPKLTKEEVRAFQLLNDVRKRAKRTRKVVALDWLWVIERLERRKCEVTKRRYRVSLHGRSALVPYIAMIDQGGHYTEDNCRVIARNEHKKISAGSAVRLENGAREHKNVGR